jgi:hypothetical protein
MKSSIRGTLRMRLGSLGARPSVGASRGALSAKRGQSVSIRTGLGNHQHNRTTKLPVFQTMAECPRRARSMYETIRAFLG